MIARVWHGVTPTSKADQYLDYLNKRHFPITELPREIKASTFCRELKRTGRTFCLLTLWESLDAIKRFAGPDFKKARYYPEDDEYLLEREPTVDQYEVEVKPERL